jgi:teichuronic acid biosynthesis glycosyltransferase TuaH
VTERTTAGRRPLVVMGGTAHWGMLRLAEHHVARHMTRYADVLFVDPPISALTVRRRPELAPLLLTQASVRTVAAGLHVITPVVLPGKDRPGMIHVTDWQTRRAIVTAVRHLSSPVAGVVLTLPQRYLFDRRLPGVRVYWAKDDHVAGAGLYGLSPRLVERMEARLARHADRFLVCSEELAATWADRGFEATVLPNGCDVGHFSSAQTATQQGAPVPTAIYVGTLAERIDTSLLEAVADEGITVQLVGGQRATASWPDGVRLLRHPNVDAVGHCPYDELPSYLGSAAVGLVPYRTDGYNQRSFPLKILEYLAAGLPVVSSDLPAARWLDSPHIQIARDRRHFAKLVRDAVSRDDPPYARAERVRFAERHDWSERAARLAGYLGLA